MFQLNGTLFPEGEGSRVPYSGKLRIKKADLEALATYVQYAPTITNSYTDGEEVVLYLKGWNKGANGTGQRYISLAAEPAAAVIRELQSRGKLPQPEAPMAF